MRYFFCTRRLSTQALLAALLLILAACGSGGGSSSTIPTNGLPRLAARQILTFPNVGITDSGPLDPALATQVTDPNTSLIMSMIYSGLVRSDSNLNVVPDQATWDISPDKRVYTFHLRPGIAFSDGTPVTAQTYVYTLTRALQPEVQAVDANLFEGVISGASEVMKGKAKTLRGVKALNAQTLQITLARPTPYFLQMLTTSIYYPVNKQIIDQYGQANWPNHVAGGAVGTGPFMIQEWQHSVKMVLVPNPYYYGSKTRLTEVDMIFANDPSTAFAAYRAGQFNFAWNLTAVDQASAKGLPGFMRTTQLETDTLFFNNKMSPFDNAVMREAFAYATDKVSLARTVFNDSVVPAATIIPPGMPGYPEGNSAISYDKTKAKELLQSIYPDVSTVPPITFSYPSSEVSQQEASALQQMWQDALDIKVTLRAVEPNAYNDELLKHQIQFGFIQWNADFSDPYDCLALYLLSTAPNNYGQWSNSLFDQTIAQADGLSGEPRMALYQQAEQTAILDVGWLPLDHEMLGAVIPSWVHGVSLNASGLYFGDWSGVYLLQH